MASASISNNRGSPATIISSVDEWERVADEFVQSMGDLKMIGLDCEWVEANNFVFKETRDTNRRGYYNSKPTAQQDLADSVRRANGFKGKVALLQLASHDGMVLLIRLCYFVGIPVSLKSLLENGEVLKVGVNIENDVKKLFADWEINTDGFVDIRNVVVQNPRFMEEYRKSGLGLKKLGNFLTGIECNESKYCGVRYSHWAAQQLTMEQIEYARTDAIMAVEGMFAFAMKYMDNLSHPSSGIPFWNGLRRVIHVHVNRRCPQYISNILDHRNEPMDDDNGTAMKKVEERRRRRQYKTEIDTSSSDIELDFETYRKSKECREEKVQDGMERAVLFKDDLGMPMAALDSELLEILKDADQPQRLTYDVKNEQGEYIYEVRVQLTKKTM